MPDEGGSREMVRNGTSRARRREDRESPAGPAPMMRTSISFLEGRAFTLAELVLSVALFPFTDAL